MPSVSGKFTRWELRILRLAIRCDTRWQIRATILGVALGYLLCLSVLLWEVGEPGGSNKWIVGAIVGMALISSVDGLPPEKSSGYYESPDAPERGEEDSR